ncbi:MAG: ArsR family transcriptional regulator [Candidatus Omnitrophota bacterium]|nr:MAG: ArsR family transcriptional regulator [Candidatus Omnitrophota bacterium]
MKEGCLDFFRALADVTRQEILELLEENEHSVNEICSEFLDITQPTVSHHLQILKRCELVITRKQGKMVYYSINKKVLRNGFEEIIERFDLHIL